MELWSLLYLAPNRTTATVASQAEWQPGFSPLSSNRCTSKPPAASTPDSSHRAERDDRVRPGPDTNVRLCRCADWLRVDADIDDPL